MPTAKVTTGFPKTLGLASKIGAPATRVVPEPEHVVPGVLEPRLRGGVALLHVSVIVDRAVDVDRDELVLVQEVRAARSRPRAVLGVRRQECSPLADGVEPGLLEARTPRPVEGRRVLVARARYVDVVSVWPPASASSQSRIAKRSSSRGPAGCRSSSGSRSRRRRIRSLRSGRSSADRRPIRVEMADPQGLPRDGSQPSGSCGEAAEDAGATLGRLVQQEAPAIVLRRQGFDRQLHVLELDTRPGSRPSGPLRARPLRSGPAAAPASGAGTFRVSST